MNEHEHGCPKSEVWDGDGACRCGTRVRFTIGPLGVLDGAQRLTDDVANIGDIGELLAENAAPFAVPNGWRVVRVGVDRYAPVDTRMFEELRP